uniref:Uncharacterized 26.1 kDa protein in ndhB-psaI intergenic region n=1 Tax=Mesostigma viride TaxID=41882 RepID=YCX1_MESVI|nr:hypothetical protein MeviCp058 [Mesostigma viride]Q9MUQ5.1 RecName: Full=Uncharacterized 26.1 kDa protein in ndhB-psaI intergenic region [Mesostigma viride]AAF43845.1 unknown [Mesostigma viride]WKT08236.1 hypothetical protein [Mesostigma viride]
MNKFFSINIILWALIGLNFHILSYSLKISISNFPWQWPQEGLETYMIHTDYYLGSILFISFLGGRFASLISQLAYQIIQINIVQLIIFFSKNLHISFLLPNILNQLINLDTNRGTITEYTCIQDHIINNGWLSYFVVNLISYDLFENTLNQYNTQAIDSFFNKSVIFLIRLYIMNILFSLLTSNSLNEWIMYSIKDNFLLLPNQLIIICSVVLLVFLLQFCVY